MSKIKIKRIINDKTIEIDQIVRYNSLKDSKKYGLSEL